METRFLVGAVILAIGLALSVFGFIYGLSSPRTKPDIIKNSQTCEVNQKLFTKIDVATLKLDMPLTTPIIDGAIELDGKEVFVCDDGKRYTWQEFWEKYKELKGD